jgi:Fe2+ or Zn2+ uptake regulation protein
MTEQQIEKTEQKFQQYLRTIGMHGGSKKKSMVLRTFLLTTKPVTVMEMASLVKREDIGLSYHTVYQTLDRLVACGIATKIESAGEGARYTHELSNCSHARCVCQDCGAVIEVMDGTLE